MPDNTPVTKADFDAGLQNLKGYIDTLVDNLKEYIDEGTHDAETHLLRGFADYNNSTVIRFRKLEADTSNIDTSTTQRLGELEKQFTDFKLRLIALEGQRGSHH
jgi:hypothetical protein